MSEINNAIKWLEGEVVPMILNNLGKQKNKFHCKWSKIKNCYFLSYVFFVDLTIINDSGEDEDTLHLAIKIPPPFIDLLQRFHTDWLYANEIIFYTQIAKNNQAFPHYYYGTADNKEKCVIVMENLCSNNFNLCPVLHDIPFKYVISGVREIGRFHAMGYVMKHHCPHKLAGIVTCLRDSRLIAGNWLHDTIEIVATRPVEWLRKTNYDPDFCNKMDKYLGDAFNTIMLDSIKPVEPLAVLCHGDFTRSNIFYKETSNELKAMLIDFGMITYASPSIDLSTLLFLNATSEDRRQRFNEIINAYHDALMDYLREAGLIDLSSYSMEKFLQDYKRCAAYGFIIAIYFLPVISGFCEADQDNHNRPHHKDAAWLMKAAGGDAMSEKFADMLLELRDTGCLDHVLKQK